MFDVNDTNYYVIAAILIISFSYFANKWKQSFEDNNDEYHIIRKYLLNDSPLYGYNRPKLWIHTKYEINARRWKDFSSRNTTDLNEPYIHYTIKTIIDHCGDDFNICLIDDQSFSKLLPSWDINLTDIAEPMKQDFRELAMLELIYYYGGMIIPNSFLCMKNLISFYENGVLGNRPFVCESINRSVDNFRNKHKLLFLPNLYIMGAIKNDPVILELVEYLKKRNRSHHFTSEIEFLGDSDQWCVSAINNQKMNLVGGELVGVKSNDRKPILLEDLMEEDYLNFHKDLVGIFIPNDEILKRPKFQWFAVLPIQNILASKIIIAKYFAAALADNVDEYSKKTEMRSVVAI